MAKEGLRLAGSVVANPLVAPLPQNARNSLKQGFVDQGAGSTAEATVRTVGQGTAGLLQGAHDATARLGIGEAGARDWQIRQLETESEQMWAVHDRRGQPFDDAQRSRLAEIDATLAPLYANQQQQTAGSFATALAGEAQAMAGKVGQLRADYRAATPVDQKFAEGLPGQLLSGAGQLGFSFAANAVGLGLPTAMAQSADQQYQDAKQAGAGEEQAAMAALQALPLGAIDQLGDKISLGPLLKALRPQGEAVVRQTLARELLKRAGRATGAGLIEGGTEYVQTVGQNALARQYDPARPLTKGANTSATVGFLLGTGAHGVGQLAEARSTPPPAEPAGTPAMPETPAGGSAAETLPGALDPAIWDPRGSVLDAQGQFTPEPAGTPNPGTNILQAPLAPATAADLNTNPPGRSATDAAQAPVFHYTPAPQLSAEERGVEQRFAQAIAGDPAAAIDAYRARNTNQGLLTINPDEARELSPDYAADKTSRGRYAPAVHEPASALAKMVYAQALAEPARTGNVLFLAGGGGSGKGSALKNAGIPAANYDIAYDGTFANGSSSAARIDQALNSGRKVDIVFIYRPQEQAWQGVEQRRLRSGRSVPYATFKNAHQNAIANVLELKESYAGNPQVNFLFLDNSGRPDEIKAVSSPEIVRRLVNDGALNQARAAEITASEERKHAGNQNGIHAPDGATPGQALGGDRAESQPSGRAPAPSRAGRGAQRGAALQTGQFDGGGDSSGSTGGSSPLGFTAKLPGGGAEVRGAWRVVEAGSIVTSQDQGYAAELQPRDRRRGASEQQVAKIAAGLDPELLGKSVTTDLGAPMVDGAQQVLSGNGRMLAIRDAYAAGASGRGAVYKQWLAAHADEFGLTTDSVQALQQPVLVRQIDDFGGLTPTEFARHSNQRQVLGMSEAEQATADAMRLRETPALLGKFAPGQDGDLLAASNREFLNDFIESTGDRAELIDSTGMGYSPRLASRVRQAVLAAVIGPEHRALLNQLIEVPEGLRKVVNSLLASAPRLLHYRGTPYDLGSALAQGLGDFISAKRAGVALADHLGQIDAFSDSLRTPASDLLARTFDELKHANRITDFLASYDRMAAQQDTTTGDMFGQAPATPMELLIRARTEAQGGGEAQAQFARRKTAATAPDKSQADMFAGGQTGGDTLFALQGEAIDATLAAWNMDDALATREAARQQARAQGAFEFATRTPEQAAVIRTRLEQLQALWMARAQRLAPGVMQAFKLAFGSPEQLVKMGRAQARSLTGYEEAAYLAHERMLFLFDRALQSNGDALTLTNLLHEMGHAHWDTLPQARQLDLLALWRDELPQFDARGRQTRGGQGPLYGKDGRLRPGVALGVEQSVKEWYAERVAWANQHWAQARMGGMSAPGAGLIGRMAQQFRAVLARLAEFVERLRGDKVTRDFRSFLAHGARWDEEATERVRGEPTAAWRRRSPAQVWDDQKTEFSGWWRRNFTSAGGLPATAWDALQRRDGRLAAIHQEMRFALRDLDRALHLVYGGYAAMTEAQTRQVNETLAGKSPLAGLDPRLRVPLTQMRQHIDVMSRRLIREGAVAGDLAVKVDANVGLYLNRSYRKFDDPKWARQVPDAVLNRARSFIAAELQAKNPLLPVDPAAVEGYVRYLLGKDVTEVGDFYRAPDKKGAMDLRIFTARKDIAPEIRELMGEYHDPRVNYLRSVAKMAQVLESHQYLAEIRSLGLREGWLQTAPRYDATGSYTVQVAGKGSLTLEPLAGLYTTPEIAQAFNARFAEPGLVMQYWRRANALAKIAKTVWSPMTQARNFSGNLGFLVANGHWRADAVGEVWQALRADFGWGDTPQRRAYYARLVRLGIVGEDVTSGELKEAIHDVGPRMGDLERWTDSRLVKAVKLAPAAAAKLYHLNDEVFKIYAFENERRAWAAAEPSWTAEQLDRIAAERVRNTLPTYSQISRAVVAARRYGLTGSFMSFPAEIVRTGYHTIGYAMEDLRSANPKVQAMGAKRLAGLALVASMAGAVSLLTRWLAGLDDEDEKDLRRFLPSWNRNAALYYQKHDGKGRFGLLDASYLDPWNYLKKPVTAALQGKEWQQALVEASLEAMDPFAGEGLVTKVGLDLARNVDGNGRQIWNPALPFLERTQQQLAHAWRAFEPGVMTQGGRIVKAARGEQDASGRVYALNNEMLAVLTGARSQSLDVGQALIFRAKRYAGELGQANRIFTEIRDRKGTVDPQELEAARQKAETARRALFAAMRADYEAAVRLGVGQGDAVLALMAGVGQEQAALISAGVYVPYVGQPAWRRQALEASVLKR